MDLQPGRRIRCSECGDSLSNALVSAQHVWPGSGRRINDHYDLDGDSWTSALGQRSEHRRNIRLIETRNDDDKTEFAVWFRPDLERVQLAPLQIAANDLLSPLNGP